MNSLLERQDKSSLVLSFTALLAISILFSGPPLLNVDWAWQLKIGDRILKDRSIPVDDQFCWTTEGITDVHPGIYYAFSILLSLTHRLAGLSGLVILKIILCASIPIILYSYFISQKVRPWTAFSFAGLCIIITSSRLVLRPQILSYFFAILVLLLLLNIRKNRKLLRLVFVFIIFVVWANFHSGSILALGLIGSFWLGEFTLLFLYPWFRSQPVLEKDKIYLFSFFITTISAVFACALTPDGWDRFTFLFSHSNMYESVKVSELSPLFQSLDEPILRKYLLVTSLLLLAGTCKKTFTLWFLWFPFIFYTILTISTNRFFPYSFYILMIIIGFQVKREMNADRTIKKWIKALTITGILGLITPSFARECLRARPLVEPAMYAPDAIEFLTTYPFPEPLYNSQNFGGYITYVTDGRLKTFRDGRQSLFLTISGRTWEDLHEQYDFKTAVVSTGEILGMDFGSALNDHWELVFFSDHARIYVDNRDSKGFDIADRFGYKHVYFDNNRNDDGKYYLTISVDNHNPMKAVSELESLKDGYFKHFALGQAYYFLNDHKKARDSAMTALTKQFSDEVLDLLALINNM